MIFTQSVDDEDDDFDDEFEEDDDSGHNESGARIERRCHEGPWHNEYLALSGDSTLEFTIHEQRGYYQRGLLPGNDYDSVWIWHGDKQPTYYPKLKAGDVVVTTRAIIDYYDGMGYSTVAAAGEELHVIEVLREKYHSKNDFVYDVSRQSILHQIEHGVSRVSFRVSADEIQLYRSQ